MWHRGNVRRLQYSSTVFWYFVYLFIISTKSMGVLLASFGSLPRSNPFLNSVFLAVDSRLFSLKYYNSTNELLMLRVTCTKDRQIERLKNIHIKDVQIIFVI